MKRFKQIITLTLIMILFAIFSDYMIRVGLRNTYKSMSGEITFAEPQVTILEAKTTDVNGYIIGELKNNLEEDINNLQLNLEIFSKRNILLGTEKIDITNLKAGEVQKFESNFRYSNANNYKISIISEPEE